MGKSSLKQVFSADFETTSAPQYEKDGYTRVWSYGICNLDNPKESYTDGLTIKDFFSLITSTKGKYGNFRKREIFFHNLKFDGEFIISSLITDYNYSSYDLDKKQPPKTYKILKDDRGILYSITMQIDEERKIIFKDSLKLLNFSVSTIGKAFNIELDGKELLKGEIDYNKYREIGYIPDANEKDYQYRDVLIVAYGLKRLFEFTGLRKSTIASMALADYKRRLPKYLDWSLVYPSMTTEEWDFIKNSYNGGWCYTNKYHQGIEYSNDDGCVGFGIDINSMYPYQMKDKPLPYGEPHYFKGKPPKGKLYIVRLQVRASLKDNALPYFRVNQFEGFRGNNYAEEINGTITLTSIDLMMLFKCYDIDFIEFYNGYWFKSYRGLFDDYIDYWMDIKAKNKGAIRTIAKLFLNSLYGKFGASYIHYNKRTIIDDDGVLMDELIDEPSIDNKLSYIPIATFITSYARCQIVTDSMKLGAYNHLYTDTDSIKFKLDFKTKEEAEKYCISKGIKIHDTELGAYKVENIFNHCKFLRAKTYVYNDLLENHTALTGCGMNKDVKDNMLKLIEAEGYEAFDYDVVLGGKLLPKRVIGGIILVDTEFSIHRGGWV